MTQINLKIHVPTNVRKMLADNKWQVYANTRVKRLFREQITGAKTVEYDGLTLSREPNDFEAHLNLKKIVDDQESHAQRLGVEFTNLRDALLSDAEIMLSGLAEDGAEVSVLAALIESFVLVTPPKHALNVERITTSAYLAGVNQVITELNTLNEDSREPMRALEPDAKAKVALIAATLVAQVNKEVTFRIVNQVVSWMILGQSVRQIAGGIVDAIKGQSQKWINDKASSGANKGIQTGRNDEITSDTGEYQFLEYSALLDKNTCSPCRRWDGVTAATRDALPDTPNPDCEGGARCRCFIVTVVQ